MQLLSFKQLKRVLRLVKQKGARIYKFNSHLLSMHNLYTIIGGVLFAWIYTDFAFDCQAWVAQHLNKKMEVLCRIISLNDSVNWIVLLLVAWATFIICKRLGRNAYYSVGLLMAGCCVLWVLFYKAEWQFIESPLWSISYKAILSAAIIAIITTDLLKLICINIKEWNKPLYAINKMGYTTDDLANLDENAVRRQYARQVMTQLLNTDVSNNSYALAFLVNGDRVNQPFLNICSRLIIMIKCSIYWRLILGIACLLRISLRSFSNS